MGQISLQLPQVGGTNLSQEPLIPGDFTTIQNVINGNLDSNNITNSLAQSAAVNTGTQTVKGAVNIATSVSRTNVAYGTLTTPDQVTGIVLPSNGLIQVWYQATWQESVSGAARAAIFLGSNQLQLAADGGAGPAVQAGATGGPAAGHDLVLASWGGGLAGRTYAAGYTGDATTGQVVGVAGLPGGPGAAYDWGGTVYSQAGPFAGPCTIFAAAGTYIVSVQFKASSGSVTAKNRKLWAQAISFA